MPIVIVEMLKRQQNELSLFREKEETLGQMAAGIAHELNNSVAVLYSSANWLLEKIAFYWQDQKESAIFEAGLLSGRHLSSKEKRDLQKIWQEKYKIDSSSAKALAQTGLPVDKILRLTDNPKKDAGRLSTLWEIGATLNDMRIAAQQSTHVVKSVKLLGAQTNRREELIDINETIENTLTLFFQKLKLIDLDTDLNELPYIMGNSGEFVQVWSNLIKNALEAMLSAKTKNPILKITSKVKNDQIVVKLQDNGPGIPEEIRESVFNPNVTTKISGMSFGLGLGLPIALRIVQSYSGDISFKSSSKGTDFKVIFPVELKK